MDQGSKDQRLRRQMSDHTCPSPKAEPAIGKQCGKRMLAGGDEKCPEKCEMLGSASHCSRNEELMRRNMR